MIVIVDNRRIVSDGYALLFQRLGVTATAFGATDYEAWLAHATPPELMAAEAFLFGQCDDRAGLVRGLRYRTKAAVIAITEVKSLAVTLDLLEAGFDDIVRKPVHTRELLARISAIRRRAHSDNHFSGTGDLKVFHHGRDPEIGGQPLSLPRRERRILEYLVMNEGCWLSKTQIFNSVYGVFSDDIDETVIESHVSRLRKRLRQRLGRDPIETQRHFGYRLADPITRGQTAHHSSS
jgi:two-component system, OmpR family, flagellar system response regulator FtcR